MNKKWITIVVVVTGIVLLMSVFPTSAAPASSQTVHVVQRGETLSLIALRYDVGMWALARANGILNPNRIYVGQRLVVPAAHVGAVIHVVQPGETLSMIARRYGAGVWDIARANGITNLNHIYVGQRLRIPGAAPPPPPPPPPPPAPVHFPGPWTGEYFDNATLSGAPYHTRADGDINFNWGYGPPAGGMPVNAFSVRWTGTFYFSEGTYRFYARVDDGVRVYVDGLRIIDGWRDGALRLYTTQQTLAAGDHTVQVEFYDRIQVARAHFWWQPSGGTAPVATPTPTPGPSPSPDTGWFAQFYNNVNLQGEPVVTRHDPWIGFEWGVGSPVSGVYSDRFSVRWARTVHLTTDHYRFCAMSDDGVRIWVDGQLVLNEWHPSNSVSYCGAHWVETGNHQVVVEYYEDQGKALIYAWWEPH